MKKRILLLFLLLFASAANAGTMLLLGAGKGAPGAAAAYSGPGDVVSGATFWGGLRAYSLAKAGTKAIRLVRASDSTQSDINSLANGSLDVATATTFCNATSCKVVTVYDQTGALACAGATACDVTQATDANRPAFTFNCYGSLPCMTFAGGSQGLTSANSFTQAQPYSFSAVAKRTAAFTSYQGMIANAAGTIGPFFQNAANNIEGDCTGPGMILGSQTDGNPFAVSLVCNTTSSALYSNASSTTGSVTNTSFSSVIWYGADGAGDVLQGNIVEGGIWPSAFSAGNAASIISNQRSYWGF